MSKGHHQIHPCPVCTAKMIMEACGCWTCESCCYVERPPDVHEGKLLMEGWLDPEDCAVPGGHTKLVHVIIDKDCGHEDFKCVLIIAEAEPNV